MAVVIGKGSARPSGEARKWYGSNWIRKVRRASLLLAEGFARIFQEDDADPGVEALR